MKKELFKQFSNSKGVKFVGVRDYEAQSGEISDFVINIGANYENTMRKDLVYLQSLTDQNLIDFCKNSVVNLETMQKAKQELENSLIKRLSGEKNARSIGQTDAYQTLTNGVRLHLESEKIHVFGFRVSKHIKVTGTYKEVKSQKKTIAKNILRKNMKSEKFRTFVLDSAKVIALNGETFE